MVVVRIWPGANSYQIPKSVSALGTRGDDQYSCRLVSRKCNKGQAHPSLGRSLPARPRLVIISRVPSWSTRLHDSRGYPSGSTRLNPVTVVKISVTVCSEHQEGIRGITLVGFPLDVSVKVNPGKSPSVVFTLAGLHDRSFVEGGKRGITLVTHNRLAVPQR